MKIKACLALIAAVLFLAACDQNKEFEAYRTLDPSGWNKDSVLVFPVSFDDEQGSYNLYLNVRNSGDYEFSNLWLFVTIQAPDGNTLTDTIEFQLADPTGRWLGKGIGDLFDNQFSYKQNVHLPASGDYLFSISQGMRANNLKGISDVGISIEKRD